MNALDSSIDLGACKILGFRENQAKIQTCLAGVIGNLDAGLAADSPCGE